MTLQARYGVPQGYKRVVVEKGSFGEFLRNQKLKPYGEKVQYFNGNYKRSEGIYDSVFDVEIGDRDLHQCADAIMLLRAEYFYGKKEYDKERYPRDDLSDTDSSDIFICIHTDSNKILLLIFHVVCFRQRKLQIRKQQHYQKQYDRHGARPAELAVSDAGKVYIHRDDVDRMTRRASLCEHILRTERFQTLEHRHDGHEHDCRF